VVSKDAISHNETIVKGKNVMENAFGILKNIFKSFLLKNNLCGLFLIDVVVCYTI
jgi:hypothetical protein